MHIEYLSRSAFHHYNQTHLRLAEQQELLNDFIGLPFSLNSIKKQIRLKRESYTFDSRKLLQTHFEVQYKNIHLSESIKKNIELLGHENSFTITTGQQLTLFGGPAFFFYKIIHCISLANKLKQIHPEYNFIPVFWLASEDHDKEEISETIFFNQNFRWESDYNGATGCFPLDENFEKIKTSISDLFSKNESNEIHELISKFYGETLAEGFINFLSELFKDYGLLVIDADSKLLKEQLIPIIKSDVDKFSAFANVSETNNMLKKQGIEPQAKIQQINFFKLSKNKRSKIKFQDNKYYIADQEISKENLLNSIEIEPEKFSPNVFLRPLYQELILPNLAYIGGPGELSYWLQLKNNFNFHAIPFPILVNRLSLYFIDSSTQKRINNLPFSLLDYINYSLVDLKKKFISSTEDFIEMNWESIDNDTHLILTQFRDKYEKLAPEIESSLEGEWKNIEKSIEKIKNKLQKQISIKHENSLKQIEHIKLKLTPISIPQERYYHFFTFCPDGSLSLMDDLIEKIDPFSTEIIVVRN
jgi:bacillithiol biosynthesis cysteine-adding enzyme BshC